LGGFSGGLVLTNSVKWNLCNFDQDRETYGVPQLCWFEEGQYITKNQGSEFYEMKVKPGTWYA
jgi:hypothetical protein